MEGSFFTIVTKIITKLFLALVSVYAPAEKESTTSEPMSTEVIVEYVIMDQSSEGVETLLIKINDKEVAENITSSMGYIILKNEEKAAHLKGLHTPEIRVVGESSEDKAYIPIRLKKV